jgi:hypothetical protein
VSLGLAKKNSIDICRKTWSNTKRTHDLVSLERRVYDTQIQKPVPEPAQTLPSSLGRLDFAAVATVSRRPQRAVIKSRVPVDIGARARRVERGTLASVAVDEGDAVRA